MGEQIENKVVTKIEERAAIEIDRPQPQQSSAPTPENGNNQSIQADKTE